MADPPPGRVVTLVLIDESGKVHGRLPPIRIEIPWLQEVAEVVTTARSEFGIDVTILRLLDGRLPDAGQSSAPNRVSYLAQIAADADLSVVPLEGFDEGLPGSSRRLPYADVNGPAADITWAGDALSKRDESIVHAEQIRTWNLSSIWRVQSDKATYWLKAVPPFFIHEPLVIEHLSNDWLPELVDYQGNRMLMKHIGGVDLYDAGIDTIKTMITRLVELQHQQSSRIDSLLRIGVPDWRSGFIEEKLRAVVSRHRSAFNSEQQNSLDTMMASVPNRLEALDRSGIPASIVHGDFHPGNWRGQDDQIRMLDWGDCVIGHPLLDFPGLLDRVDASLRDEFKSVWCEQWRMRYPAADLEQASLLVEPIAALRMASVYQMFLDNIEPSEHIYHEDDPVACITRALASC